VEYSSVSNWKVAHNNLHAQDAYLNIIKHIFLRESSLIKIGDLVQMMDHLYWKYANIFIARKQYFKNNESSDELKQMRLQIHSKQELLSVAIAHHRSISVDIVEGVEQWRRHLQKDVQMTAVASLFWNGQNYLIKMLHDTPKLFHTQTMWMWLGFEADCFIIPPRHLNPHTERLNRERKFHKWKQKRDDHNTAALKKLMSQQVMYRSVSTVEREAVRRQASQSQVNHFGGAGAAKPIPRRGKVAIDIGSRPGSAQNPTPLASSQSTPTLPPIAGAQIMISSTAHTQSAVALTPMESESGMNEVSTCLLAPRRARRGIVDEKEDKQTTPEENSVDGTEDDDYSLDSSSVTSILTDDTGSGWRDLRDSCKPSWDYYFNSNIDSDDVDPFDQEEDFWLNLDHNEHMVEAAMGYLVLFPKKYIVPPMKKVLSARCRACEQVLHDEVALAERVQENIAESKELQMNFEKEKLQEYLEELDSEGKQIEHLLAMEQLQTRQMSNNVRDQFHQNEISREYVAGLLDSRKPNERYISSARTKGRSLSPSRASPTRLATSIASPRQKNNNMFAVFLTAPSIANDQDFTQSTMSFIPENIVCKIDSSVLKERIEAVVDNDRQACIRVGSSLVMRNRMYRDNRARAYQNKKAKKRNALQAIVFMQALVRGVITRQRLSRKSRMQSKVSATLFIQKCLRRYIRRCRERVKRRLFKADCLRVRREILESHRSADILITFFKYLIFLKKRRYYMNKYAAIARLDVPRMTRVLKSALMAQSLFRGYSTRKWFSNILNDSRKRAKIGPKYKKKIVAASRRQHHYTVSGSGGFQYWWRNHPAETSTNTELLDDGSVTMLSTEQTESSVFMTNVSNDLEIQEKSALISTAQDREQTRKDQEHSNRRQSVGMVSEEDSSSEGLSLSVPDIDLLAVSRSLELKKRSTIRGKIAMLKGGSRSHHKGVSLLRAVPTKERAFLPHKGSQSVSGGSVSNFSSSSVAPRSHTLAYENPNVHFKAKQERSGGLSGSLFSNSLDPKRSNELNGLLQDVYGFQK
jgi:hypothetical protein